jgi:hypothetical protein
MIRFTDEEVRRYARQLVLPEVGGVGQERLRAATLAAESETEALYLAAAGVGTIYAPTEAIAAAARALNPLSDLRVDGALAAAPDDVEAGAARAVEKLLQALAL